MKVRHTHCAKCKQPLTPEIIAAREAQRRARHQETIALARQHGDPIGRPITVNVQKILDLKRRGLTFRAIAEEAGCSASTAQKHCAKAGI